MTFARVELLKFFPRSTKKTDVVLVLGPGALRPTSFGVVGSACDLMKRLLFQGSASHCWWIGDSGKRVSVPACSTDFFSDWPCVSPETSCEECDIVQSDHAPQAGVAQGIFNGDLIRRRVGHQVELEEELEEEVERRVRRDHSRDKTQVRMHG